MYDKMEVKKMEVRKQQTLGHARKIEIRTLALVTCGDNLTCLKYTLQHYFTCNFLIGISTLI